MNLNQLVEPQNVTLVTFIPTFPRKELATPQKWHDLSHLPKSQLVQQNARTPVIFTNRFPSHGGFSIGKIKKKTFNEPRFSLPSRLPTQVFPYLPVPFFSSSKSCLTSVRSGTNGPRGAAGVSEGSCCCSHCRASGRTVSSWRSATNCSTQPLL